MTSINPETGEIKYNKELNSDLIKVINKIVQPIGTDLKEGVHNSKYAPLQTVDKVIKQAIKDAGVDMTFSMEIVPINSADTKAREQILLHIIHPTGERIFNGMVVTNGSTDQLTAGSVTYAKRLTLCAVFGVVADVDDDGASSSAAQALENKQNEIRMAMIAHFKELLSKVPKELKSGIFAVIGKDELRSNQIDKLSIATASTLYGAAKYAENQQINS